VLAIIRTDVHPRCIIIVLIRTTSASSIRAAMSNQNKLFGSTAELIASSSTQTQAFNPKPYDVVSVCDRALVIAQLTRRRYDKKVDSSARALYSLIYNMLVLSMRKSSHLNTQSAVPLVRELAQQSDGFVIIQQLIFWLALPHQQIIQTQKAHKLSSALHENPTQAQHIARIVLQWLISKQLYPALVGLGIFARRGFFSELTNLIYNKINPAPPQPFDLKDALTPVLTHSVVRQWLHHQGADELISLGKLLLTFAPETLQHQWIIYSHNQAWYALEMLGIWVAAEEIEPDLMRLEPRLNQPDSPFIALHREISLLQQANGGTPLPHHEHSDSDRTSTQDLAHFAVILAQCAQLLERLKRRGAGFGSSVTMAHLLERLEQTMARIEVLVHILHQVPHDKAQANLDHLRINNAAVDEPNTPPLSTPPLSTPMPTINTAPMTSQSLAADAIVMHTEHPSSPPSFRHSAELDQFIQQLCIAVAQKTSLRAFMRRTSHLLSRSITINSSSHGEHYIAHDRSQFFRILRSAAGAGIVIALMALHKIHIEGLGLTPLGQAFASSLNYGIGFVLIHVLHFTVATKQPAMTAASVAASIEKNDQGRATHKKLAGLLIAVNRTQWAAVWGNVSLALMLSCAIAFGFQLSTGQPLLSDAQVTYQQLAISPWHGSLFFAAIAGVWLFLAGIIAGYVDNRANYLQLDLRLIHHPWLQHGLTADRRQQLATYIHQNYGAIAGNLGFGFLLGMTPYLGHLMDIPIDIRHVAFAAANLGFSGISADAAWWHILAQLPLVLAIGFVNLWVSFTLAIWVALDARNVKFSQLRLLGPSLWQQIKQQPWHVFIPEKR